MKEKILVRMQFGSHVYGTNLPSSDLDYKAIHLPDKRDILLQRAPKVINNSTKKDNRLKNQAGDIDFESFSLQQYFKLLLEGQTVALSMLFTPKKWFSEGYEYMEIFKEGKDKFLHKQISPFVGYCRQQANKYGIKGSRVAAARDAVTWCESMIIIYGEKTKLRDIWDSVQFFANSGREHIAVVVDTLRGREDQQIRMLEVCNKKVQEHTTVKEAYKVFKHIFDEYGHRALQAEKQENVDWKALMHAVRVCNEACELLIDHTITYPRPEADYLLKVRKGELSYQEVSEYIENGLKRLEECQLKSTLPERPDHAFIEDAIYGIYEHWVEQGEEIFLVNDRP